MRKFVTRLLQLLAGVLTGAAIVEQLTRSSADRTWTGRILGVPYDFRPPTLKRVEERVWNPRDERIFTPTVFGVGWTINFYQLKRRLLLLIA